MLLSPGTSGSLPPAAAYAPLPHCELCSYCVHVTGIIPPTLRISGFLNHVSYSWCCRINQRKKKKKKNVIHSRAAMKLFFAIPFSTIKSSHSITVGSPEKHFCFDFWTRVGIILVFFILRSMKIQVILIVVSLYYQILSPSDSEMDGVFWLVLFLFFIF